MRDDRRGVVGCGCALIPGLLLGVVLYAVIGVYMGAAAAPPPSSEAIHIAVSTPYLSRLIAMSVSDERVTAWQVSVQPGEEIELQAQITVKAFGQTMALPARFRFHVEARDGRLGLQLQEANLPAGQDANAAASIVAPLAGSINDFVQREIARDLGGGWYLAGLSTDQGILVLSLQTRSGQ